VIKCPVCGSISHDSVGKCPECFTSVIGSTQSFEAIDDAATVQCNGDVSLQEAPELIITRGPGVGERFSLQQGTTSIGRDPGADIFLNDITVSRTHARIVVYGDQAEIVDTKSLNGTYVDGISIDRANLETGDVLQIGKFQLVFVSMKAR